MSILGIKNERVSNIIKKSFNNSGGMAKKNRGGDHRSKTFSLKRVAVKKFIESFKGSEPHYCRHKSDQRLYLDAKLNI